MWIAQDVYRQVDFENYTKVSVAQFVNFLIYDYSSLSKG